MTNTPPALLSEADYDAIETALETTEKGRLFLRAHLERNRSPETQRLLRSITRLHRATIGEPGHAAEIGRDVYGALRAVTQLRTTVASYQDERTSASLLTGGIEEVEARLMMLAETIEDLWDDGTSDASHAFDPGIIPTHGTERSAKLFGELSYLFSGEPYMGPAEAS